MVKILSKIDKLLNYKSGVSPAKIYLEIPYDSSISYVLRYNGFSMMPTGSQLVNKALVWASSKFGVVNLGSFLVPQTTIKFQIPVTPPTVEMDFGNEKDSEKVARTGEVVLPKYKKSAHFKWDSIFPYDLDAPYLTIKRISNSTFNTLTTGISNIAQSISNLTKSEATPEVYNAVFKYLSDTEQPCRLSMSFYSGGNLPATYVTLESFNTHPDNNGDYSYTVSFIEWNDTTPSQLDSKGASTKMDTISTIEQRVNVQGLSFKNLGTMGKVFSFMVFCKKAYGCVSKKLIWALAKYNNIRHLINFGNASILNIKSSFKSLSNRLSLNDNLLGKSKITSDDTKLVCKTLKELSQTEGSKRMAEFLESLRSS
jgi:hypothetical protein